MKKSKAPVPSIWIISSEKDRDRIEGLLKQIQKDFPVWETTESTGSLYPSDASDSFPEPSLILFFASEHSIQNERIIHTIRNTAGRKRQILTVYLDVCNMSEGLHMLLDAYQAILPQTVRNPDNLYSDIYHSITDLMAGHPPYKRSTASSFPVLIILATVFLSACVFPAGHSLMSMIHNESQPSTTSPIEYPTLPDTTKDPSVFAEAFFDMARIGGEKTYQNLWDRFVADEVKTSHCITKGEWMNSWKQLENQGFEIVESRVSSKEQTEKNIFLVSVDLRFRLGDRERRQTEKIYVLIENDFCKYLEGEPVSTKYLPRKEK